MLFTDKTIREWWEYYHFFY